MARNYRREYQTFHGRPAEIRKRAARNKARSMMAKEGKVRKYDSKDVDHVLPLKNGGGNGRTNLRVSSITRNRSRKT